MSTEDYAFFSNTTSNFSYLVYLDSRGSRSQFEDQINFATLLKDYFNTKKETYRIIVREFNLTTFLTLMKYLKNVDLKTTTLITNVGFVDYTPKKIEILNEFILNGKEIGVEIEPKKVETKYKLSDGIFADLYSNFYTYENIKSIIEELKALKKILFINSSENFKNRDNWDRKRPNSFFKSVVASNDLIQNLNHQLKNSVIIDSLSLETFDGVHYLEKSHLELFNRIKKLI